MTDTFEAIYEETRALYPGPQPMRLRGLPTHRRIIHVGHGWYMRLARTCDAVLLLRHEGYGAEAWPVRRAAHEHLTALLWLADRGNQARDVIVRNHAHFAKTRFRASEAAGWQTVHEPVWSQVRDDATSATDNQKDTYVLGKTDDRTLSFGGPEALAGWQLESNHSHPGWESAAPYLSPSPPELLTEPRFDDGLGDIHFCAQRVIQGLNALSSMVIDDPWREPIDQLVARGRVLAGADEGAGTSQ